MFIRRNNSPRPICLAVTPCGHTTCGDASAAIIVPHGTLSRAINSVRRAVSAARPTSCAAGIVPHFGRPEWRKLPPFSPQARGLTWPLAVAGTSAGDKGNAFSICQRAARINVWSHFAMGVLTCRRAASIGRSTHADCSGLRRAPVKGNLQPGRQSVGSRARHSVPGNVEDRPSRSFGSFPGQHTSARAAPRRTYVHPLANNCTLSEPGRQGQKLAGCQFSVISCQWSVAIHHSHTSDPGLLFVVPPLGGNVRLNDAA